MRLNHVRIHNFRSIAQLDIDCNQLVVLLGPNNHGKSNILAALDFGLSTSAKISSEDFFAFRDKADKTLWVDLDFVDLTSQEATTFKKHLDAAATMRMRKKATIGQDGTIVVSYHGMETGEEGAFLGPKNIAGVLPDFFLVPAVRDLTDELKIKNTTTFGRLLQRAIQDIEQREHWFDDLRQKLDEAVEMLNSRDPNKRPAQLAALENTLIEELRAWNVKVEIEVAAPQPEKLFEIGTQVFLDDGLRTTADRKGHGLQRAMVFALLRAWSKALHLPVDTEKPAPRKSSESVIFAIEEPELFLHPQAQARLAESLRALSQAEHHQVFECTHSSHFVDLDYYKDIVIVSKPDSRRGTEIRQCTNDLFEGETTDERKKRFHMAYWVNPDRGRLFFAKKVVLVEGETEAAVLPLIAQKINCFDSDVTIVECGSKHNLPLYIALLNAFQMPYLVVHDEDPLPEQIPAEWNEDKVREKHRTFALNEEIAHIIDPHLGGVWVFPGDFENAAGISHTQADRKGKALAALDYLSPLHEDLIPAVLKQVVRLAYSPAKSAVVAATV